MSDNPALDTQQADAASDARLARILLQASILREVDEIVLAGRGGYRTRQEFFAEAIQNLILEVKHGITEGGQLAISADLSKGNPGNGRAVAESAAPSRSVAARSPVESLVEAAAETIPEPPAVKPITDLAETALPLVADSVTIENAIGMVKQEPMIGLHNRDYPSFWAAIRLAAMTHDRLVPPQEFLDEITREAWGFAAGLLPLENRSKVKLTALFPTNQAKPQSAEASFRAFAVGGIARRPNDDGTVNVAEALFSWGAAQVTRDDGRLLLGLTDDGHKLLERMEGLTLAWPHEREHASVFIDYVKAKAPWDWQGFAHLLEAAAERPNRAALTHHFNRWQPDWSETLANTNAAGYVGRAREWGLLEPKLVEGRYLLTEFGDEIRKEA